MTLRRASMAPLVSTWRMATDVLVLTDGSATLVSYVNVVVVAVDLCELDR